MTTALQSAERPRGDYCGDASFCDCRRNAEAAAARQPEPIKAWCVDRPSGTLVVIGTRADAESIAGVMRAAGKEELMLSGPYEFTIAVKP